jgi:predicted O-linked N-acetylglucosamine transferase (SPINDLY family)
VGAALPLLPELATETFDDYEALALRLATQPAFMRSVRMTLSDRRASCPLFDTDRFREHIEAAYTTMWKIWQRGEEPRSFSIDPI